MLLASDTGHFSLIRALHLADLITELNGKIDVTIGHHGHMQGTTDHDLLILVSVSFLRHYVHIFIYAILSR